MKAKKTFEQNLAKFDSRMESSKQQSIIKFFQKKTNSENQVSGTSEERGRTSLTASVSGELLVRTEEETNPTASNLQHGLKRSCNIDLWITQKQVKSEKETS